MSKTLDELRRQPHWSFSSLNGFLNICSLQWAFRKIYFAEPEFVSAALPFGRAFHRACEHISQLRMNGNEIDIDSVCDLFATAWTEELTGNELPVRYKAKESAESLRETGERMLRTYVDALDPAETVLATSVPFSVDLTDINGDVLDKPLIGELDLVIEHEDSAVIVDWKTSERRWSPGKTDRDLQPTVYLLAYAATHDGEPALFRYDVVTKAKTPCVERHLTIRVADDFNRLAELVKLADRMVEAEHFVPNEQSFYCSGCPFQSDCRSWHRRKATSPVYSIAA
jgi:hypothetical protein